MYRSNKQLNRFIKIFFYLISPLYLFIIILISPILRIRFGLLPSERIGEIALRCDIYMMNVSIGNSSPTKNKDIFTLTDSIANKTHLFLVKKKINIVPSAVGYPVYQIFKNLSKKFHFFNQFIIPLSDKDYKKLYSKTSVQLSVDDHFIRQGEEFLSSLNINKDSKIVCLIVRDKKYLKSKFPKKDWSYHDHRDSNIESYREAVNFAIDKGYYVFQMGEDNENYLQINNSKFIQYSKNYRTDFLDVYLAKRCEFCITNGTGWDILPAYSFKKPIVWTNVVPAGDPISFSHRYIFSIKLHYHKKKEKFLSLKEIHDMDLSFKFSSKDYTDSNVVLIENNPGEIKKMTEEMIDTLSNKIRYSSEDVENQKKLLKIYNECILYKNGNHINSFSRMGQFFLNQNQFLIEKKLS